MLWRTKHTRVHNLVRKHKPGEVVHTVVTAVRSAEAKRILSRPGLHEAAQTTSNKVKTKYTHSQVTLWILECLQKRIVIQKSALQRLNVTHLYMQGNGAN